MLLIAKQYELQLLLCQLLMVFGSVAALRAVNYYQMTSGSISIRDSSTELLTEPVVDSDGHCVMKCRTKACAAAIVRDTANQRCECQLLIIKAADLPNLSPESFVARDLRPGDGERVWKADDFDKQLRKGTDTRVFTKSGTGRSSILQTARVEATGCYRIEAFGARGGFNSQNADRHPGRGAYSGGNFHLITGLNLAIVVGQVGENSYAKYSGSGGGGASFVYTGSTQPLVAAGGGGGASYSYDGNSGLAGTSGSSDTSDGKSANKGLGGTGGDPGKSAPSRFANYFSTYCMGGPGAGWNGNAISNTADYPCDGGGGMSRAVGWFGGIRGDSVLTGDGGFGGGGGGAKGGNVGVYWQTFGSSGGGGGYSGGGAGAHSTASGGGGGSACFGRGCVTVSGGNSDADGRVILTRTNLAACD